MYHSGEIRWFYREGPRADVKRWFSSCSTAITETPRKDSYVILPRCTKAGVKIRQGNIEVKAQTQPPVLARFTDRVSGHQDAWVKWSRPASDPGDFLAAPTFPERWAHVEKARTLRMLSLEAGQPREIALGSQRLRAGCQAERTDLRVLIRESGAEPSAEDWDGAERWWSFSLESFGQPDDVGVLLRRAAAYWFDDNFPAMLGAEDSMSYPQWLADLEQRQAV